MKCQVIQLTDKTFQRLINYNLENEDDPIDLSYICEETLRAFFEKNIKRKVKVHRNDHC